MVLEKFPSQHYFTIIRWESDPNATTDGPTSNAVQQAIANGVYVVAAAGNDGGPEDDERVATPSDVPLVISVGALDSSGEVWEGSSLGYSASSNSSIYLDPNKKPEVSAPGVSIVSTAFDNEYYSSTGTSDATVFVSGILALVLEAQPSLIEPSEDCILQVKYALKNPSVPLDGDIDHDSRWGYGAIDGVGWLNEIQSNVQC